MSMYASAIAERLKVISSSDSPGSLKILRPARTTYSVSRLGLLNPTGQIRAAAQAASKQPSPYGKGTYKLTRVLLDRLRARASATEKYQYSIVAEAVEEYLDRFAPAKAPPVQARIDNGCWHRLKRAFVARFRPVRRTMFRQ